MNFCGEIQYDALDGSGIHSDLCWSCRAKTSHELTDEHRALLHAALDEWLNKSNSTGAFWVGDPKYFVGWGA